MIEKDTPPQVNHGPLSGIRVLDLSRILAGPTCTQLMGDYGADIIKVEKPGLGDDTRAWGPPYVTGPDDMPTAESAYYLSANRNKRSFAIDITTPKGAETVRQLATQCDIMVENFKVGGLAKYDLDYDAIAAVNPAIIYCAISGFGQTGPNAHLPGYDLLAQAFGGIMSLTGAPDGEPMKVGVAVADVVCGLYACTAVLAALQHRTRTGEGQYIDIGLADTQIAWLINNGTNYLTSGQSPKRLGNEHPNIVPYQVFATIDGHIVVAAGNDAQYARFCGLIGRDDLASHADYLTNMSRVKHRDTLIPILANEIAKLTKAGLVAKMEQHGVPGGPINTLPEVFDSEQVISREMKIVMPHASAKSGAVDLIGNPVKFSKTPVSYRYSPPTCGEHSDDITAELLTNINSSASKSE